MLTYRSKLSPGTNRKASSRYRQIVDFWTGLHNGEGPGETTWEVLDELELLVTDSLSHDPPDFRTAESLTAKAALLIAGCIDL